MKIFALSRTFGDRAGYEKSFMQYLRAFRKLSHEVSVLYEDEGSISEDSDFPRYQTDGLYLKPNGKQIEKGFSRLQELFNTYKPDLIFLNHVQNPALMEWLISLKNCRVIRRLALHDLYCLNGNKILKSVDQQCPHSFGWRCLMNTYTNHCDTRRPDRLLKHFSFVQRNLNATSQIEQIVSPSRYMKSVLIENGIEPNQICVIPPYCTVPQKMGEEGQYMLFVGRIDATKGLDSLLQALKLMSHPPKLVVVGDGPTAEENKSLVRKLGLQNLVEFKGYCSPQEVGEYQRRCSFLVFPSVWQEPSGSVSVEAMSWGKPVVAFDVGGVSDYIKDGVNGFLVPRKDVKALADRMELLARDENLRNRMGEAGRNFVQTELNETRFEARITALLQGFSK